MTFGHHGGFPSGGFGESGRDTHRSPGPAPSAQPAAQPVPAPSTGVTLGWMAAALLLVVVLGVGGALGVNAVSAPAEHPSQEPAYTEHTVGPQEAGTTPRGAVEL